ncbi:MAG TPA: molybdate ABC transporter substrate-binding protein [Acidobacteriota bacterium]|nr:molybdate ABC transporter substrate-binding protein [Acidobacteriota bacterium]
MIRIRFLLLILGLAGLPAPSEAVDVLVAAAADLNFAMKEMSVPFEKQTGHRLKISFGSSGNFYSQIVNGAPYDMFFSADMSYPRRLQDSGKGEAGTLFVYGLGQIVLWVPNASAIDLVRTGMRALADPTIRKIAIANPVHAPYGRAAVSAMSHAAVYHVVKDKLVSGESVLQAMQFVQSGAADIGIIPLSLALAPDMRRSGRYWLIPQEAYPKIEQGALILSRAGQSGHLDAARAFSDWIQSKAGRDILARFGFLLSGERDR